MKVFVYLFLVLLLTDQALGANRDVCPSCTYTTIQNALDSSISGDTVRVIGGTFNEELYINAANRNLRIEGGYASGFASRNQETIVNGRIQLSASSPGLLEVDQVTFENSSSQGIYTSGVNADLTVTNSIIRNAASYGIYAYDPGNISIDSCEIYGNGSYGGIGVQRVSALKAITVTRNTIHSNTCFYCAGIEITQILSADLIQGNNLHGNETGIRIAAPNGTEHPTIENNRLYQNTAYGMTATNGAPIIRNNYFYRNVQSGLYYYSVNNSQVLNNLFALNGPYGSGMRLGVGSGAPVIRNNIFYYQFHGLYLDSNNSPVPSEVSHNAFFHDQILDYRDLHTGSSEVPGDYNDINHFSWASNNLVIDPRFSDPDNNDFSLQSDSFLIDEGDPSSDYSLEPIPNGGRVNIGPQGATSLANISSAAPTLSNLTASQDDSDIKIGFDTNTSRHDLWVTISYYDGSGYQTISASTISGTTYSEGYTTGRIIAGSGQNLTWVGAATILGLGNITTRIKVKLEQGAESVTATSTDLNLNFVLPTPTPTPTPSPTPTLTPSPTATPTPTPTPTVTVTVTPTPTPSSNPTQAPTATPTSTPTPTASPTAAPSPTPTTAPTEIPIPEPSPGKSPVVTVKKIQSNLGFRIKLPITIKDADSTTCRVAITVSRDRAPSKSLGSKLIKVPTKTGFTVDVGKVKLSVGKWKYCATATDEGGHVSKTVCAELRILQR